MRSAKLLIQRERGHRIMASMKTGAKWITRERRLAIYMRDGFSCVYCGSGIEDGAALQLDHCEAKSNGGNNANNNLVTACRKCNSSRGNRPQDEFILAVAQYLGVRAWDISLHIATRLLEPVDVDAAKELIAHRGSYTNVLNDLAGEAV